MRTNCLIEGMQILSKYYNTPNGFNNGADHDVVFMYPTDKPVSLDDLNRLNELGWFQYECGYEGVKDYRQSETWAAFV